MVVGVAVEDMLMVGGDEEPVGEAIRMDAANSMISQAVITQETITEAEAAEVWAATIITMLLQVMLATFRRHLDILFRVLIGFLSFGGRLKHCL